MHNTSERACNNGRNDVVGTILPCRLIVTYEVRFSCCVCYAEIVVCFGWVWYEVNVTVLMRLLSSVCASVWSACSVSAVIIRVVSSA